MFVAAIIILLSLSCRIPFDFFLDMIVIPTIITVAIIVGLHVYYERKGGDGEETKH
jgi:branched-subunit amino acid transport protein AzlD